MTYLPAPETTDAEFEVGQATYEAMLTTMKVWAYRHLDECTECRSNLFSNAISKPYALMKHLYYTPLVQDYRSEAMHEQGINIGLKECRDIADQVKQGFMADYPHYYLEYGPAGEYIQTLKFRNQELLRWFLEDQGWQEQDYLLFALQEDGSYAPRTLFP